MVADPQATTPAGSRTTTPAESPRGIEHSGHRTLPVTTTGNTSTPIERTGRSTTATPVHNVDRAPAGSGKPIESSPAARDLATAKVNAGELRDARFPGASVVSTDVTKTDSAAGRREFDASKGPKEQYLKGLAASHSAAELHAAGLNDADIEDLKAGYPPEGYEVHHIVALSQGGTNQASNLVLMPASAHRLITAQQNSAMAGMKYGDRRVIEIIKPPAGTIVWRGAQ
jgi:hypothetical protein